MSARLQPDATTRLLVIAPHPDDETLGCGELMQAVAAAGGVVAILLLTDGEANPWPQRWIERRWRLRAEDRARWARRRLGEMQAALQCMGLGDVEVKRMGWPDLGLTALALDAAGQGWRALIPPIRSFAPNLVVCPDLGDRHPDHGSAHVMARLALQSLDLPACRVLGYLLHGSGMPSSPWSLAADDGGRGARKRMAVECYGSQLRLSGRRFRAWAARPEIYRAPEAATAAIPWRPGPVVRWFAPVLALVDRRGVQSWSWRSAPLARRDDGHYHFEDLQRFPPPGLRFLRLASRWRGPWIFDIWGWWCAGDPRMDGWKSMRRLGS